MPRRAQHTTVRARRQRTAATAPRAWSSDEQPHEVGARPVGGPRAIVALDEGLAGRPPPRASRRRRRRRPGRRTPTRARKVRLTSGSVARWSWWVDGEARPAVPSPHRPDAASTPRWRLSVRRRGADDEGAHPVEERRTRASSRRRERRRSAASSGAPTAAATPSGVPGYDPGHHPVAVAATAPPPRPGSSPASAHRRPPSRSAWPTDPRAPP